MPRLTWAGDLRLMSPKAYCAKLKEQWELLMNSRPPTGDSAHRGEHSMMRELIGILVQADLERYAPELLPITRKSLIDWDEQDRKLAEMDDVLICASLNMPPNFHIATPEKPSDDPNETVLGPGSQVRWERD